MPLFQEKLLVVVVHSALEDLGVPRMDVVIRSLRMPLIKMLIRYCSLGLDHARFRVRSTSGCLPRCANNSRGNKFQVWEISIEALEEFPAYLSNQILARELANTLKEIARANISRCLAISVTNTVGVQHCLGGGISSSNRYSLSRP